MQKFLWRWLMIFLWLVFGLFVLVQYNDPDPALWMTIYGIAAVWTGIAAFAPHLLANRLASALLLVTIVATVGALAYFWPQHAEWWRRDVFWTDEESREGIGLMIVAVGLLLVAGRRLSLRAQRHGEKLGLST
jgi:hypothetical protein